MWSSRGTPYGWSGLLDTHFSPAVVCLSTTYDRLHYALSHDLETKVCKKLENRHRVWKTVPIKSLFSSLSVSADLRWDPEELRFIWNLEVPQFGLCPHAVSLHHRPGGHVFSGYGAVFPGRPGEGRKVSGSGVDGITHYVNYCSELISLKVFAHAGVVFHWLRTINRQEIQRK